MKLVSAYLIYNGALNEYVDDGTYITLNCQTLQAFSPRPVWLQRNMIPAGDGTGILYQPTFEVNSTDLTQFGTNLIQGFWIEQDGKGMMIDIASANTLTTACNQCCDDSPAAPLARFYTSGIALFSQPVEATYCITRLDDGSAYAHNQFSLAYTGQYHGNARLISNISGVSRYRVTSWAGWPPTPRGTDTVVLGTCS